MAGNGGDSPPRHAWHEAAVRVRYSEVDPQGVVHHSAFIHYFEFGRTEMLRSLGLPYRRIEEEGTLLMVTECRLRYLAPARYDDVLRVRTRVDRVSRVRIFLAYEVVRSETGEVACEGETTLAAMGADGKPRALPEALARLMAERTDDRGGRG